MFTVMITVTLFSTLFQNLHQYIHVHYIRSVSDVNLIRATCIIDQITVRPYICNLVGWPMTIVYITLAHRYFTQPEYFIFPLFTIANIAAMYLL